VLKKNYIFAPGPVTVPPQVLAATAKPIIHHRSPDFDPLFKKVNASLKTVFQTQNPVVTLASSGTGAMEAAIVGTASPGDRVLSIEGGKFGERWGEIAQAYGFDAHRMQVEWGTAFDPNVVADELKKHPETKAVYVELCETSTGTLFPVKEVAEITRSSDAVLIVDAVSGLAADELRTDEWGVDMVGAGSQKGLMLPPGLGFVSVSEKAREALKKSKTPKFYFNLVKALKELEANTTPFTPAVSLLFGAEVALGMLEAEGVESIWKRHAVLAEGGRRAMKAIGCELYSAAPANTITAVKVPEGVEGGKIVKTLREQYGVIIAGGQGHLKGKIFRFATLGWYNEYDVVTIVTAVEQTLAQLGVKFERGAGAAAAMEYFNQQA
jgi:serine---pyruvate transaminase